MDKLSPSSADMMLFALHKVSAIVFLLGLLFLVVWVLKNVKKDKLKKLSITLLVLGVLGGLLAGMLGGGSYRSYKKFGYKNFDHKGVFKCMKDSSCKSELDALLIKRGY